MGALIAFGILILTALWLFMDSSNGTTVFQTSDGDNVTSNDSPTVPQHIVPTDPRTWPSGDRIWDCCRAIAIAEGYNIAGSVPAIFNNPGDLSDGKDTYGSQFHSGSNVTTFPDATTGWSWLYTKLNNAVNGVSKVYNVSMSWREIGAKWAPPNADVWAQNVAGSLGVDPDSSLGDYVNS